MKKLIWFGLVLVSAFCLLYGQVTQITVSKDPNAIPVIAIPDSTNWIFLDPPDSGHLLKGRSWGRFGARVYEQRELLREPNAPDSLLYLALPYGRNDRAIRALSALYEFRDEHPYARGGYAISTFRMTKRRP